MFSSQINSVAVSAKIVCLLLFLLLALSGCMESSEKDFNLTPSVLAKNTIDTETPNREVHREELRFYGVVRGLNSYAETVFRSGKIVALNIKEGQIVNAGDTIVVLYSPILEEQLKKAKAALKRIEVQLKLDLESLNRNKTLHKKNVISQQNLDEAKRNHDTSRQAKKEAEAAVASAQNEFSDTSIKAKERGVISRIYKREGDFVNPGESVFRFESISRQRVSFGIPEKLAVNINFGDKHILFFPSIEKTLEGFVIEKSLPTENELRLHTITLEINSTTPDLVGLQVMLRHFSKETLAYKIDYRAIRYDFDKNPYVIEIGDNLSRIPVSILDLKKDNALVVGKLTEDTQILIGNDVSVPVNLSKF